MDSLRYAGWTHTDPADPEEAVTDSAAAATAFGVKTQNTAVHDAVLAAMGGR
jgi:alkaline phosphatase